MALVQYPVLNSSVDEKCENITFKVIKRFSLKIVDAGLL